MIKRKLKKFSSELKMFKVQTIFILEYKKKNYCKTFHSNSKLIASDSDIDEAYKIHASKYYDKIKNYVCKDWIVLDTIIKHSIKIFEC